MPAQKIAIDRFLELSQQFPVLDVRSPGEYLRAHIPGAYSFPLFTDEERAMVGTAYKQQGRETAIKIGLDYFGVKMRTIVEQAESLASPAGKTMLVHCWRGGMRSAGVAWLLDMYGFNVFTLAGGYKTFRAEVLKEFEKPRTLNILGGFTGSGKTGALNQLELRQQNTIDLEQIAKHKGSAFGAMHEIPQPSQEMFENLLALELKKKSGEATLWLEDESQRIGHINLPMPLWRQMRTSPVYFIDIPFEQRLANILAEYGSLPHQELAEAIIRIKKRLGGLETKTAVQYLSEGNIMECFRILLKYYDKHYLKGLQNRENLKELLHRLPCETTSAEENAAKLAAAATSNQALVNHS